MTAEDSPIPLEPTAQDTAPLLPLPPPPRSEPRRFAGAILITTATALALGVTLKAPTNYGANDISRWCTVWSLLEKGTYRIDDCPWQADTQDKVVRLDKLAKPGDDAKPLKKFEYVIAPNWWKEGEPAKHTYSSKPPLLPTMIAGILYPFRKATGVPLGKVVIQERNERWVEKVDEETGEVTHTLEKPDKPAKWPVYVFYFQPIVLLFNIVPLLAFLVLYARLLDRLDLGDWAWFLGLTSAAFGTYLLAFDQTLNNHTIAAYSAFFSLYALQKIWDEGARSPLTFAACGFWGAFCACNEIPAALFGILLFLVLLVRFPKQTLLYFVPAAAVPCVAFLATEFLAFGQFTPVYEEFGTKSYEYYGSYWTTPLEMDWYNKHPEPKGVYLFHMTFGHHGVFSLTPIFLFALLGALFCLPPRRKLALISWLTWLLTIALIAFYAWNPKARNYGGSTQGLRWLFWLIPFWLITLPVGLEPGQTRRWYRWLTLAALFISVMSVGYALRMPWSHPWFMDMLEHLDIITLER